MARLFASAWIVDAIIVFMIVEAAGLGLYRHWTGRGVAPAGLVLTLLSGMSLLLALREALLHAWWGWIGFWLFVSLLAHLLDLRQRWRP